MDNDRDLPSSHDPDSERDSLHLLAAD